MNVLLVGCGFTSTLTAFLLRSKYPNIHLTLWDKARGPGGRASLRRGPNETFVDLGTQFITTNNSIISKYSVIYDMLISSNNLVPMICKVVGMRESPDDKHFIAPNGTSSVVKYLLDNSKVNDIKFGRRICTILPTGNVKCIDGYEQSFDLIIITNPIPQILELECPILQTVRQNISDVTYSTRFTFNMFYDKPILKVDWDVKFLNDETFRYVSIDNRKRGKYNTADCVVFHTTKEFGQKNINETRDSIFNTLNDKVFKLFPDWPEPVYCNTHKWLYSQVNNSYNNKPGCVILHKEPIPIIAGGDGFTQSTFNGCLESAFKICETVLNLKISNK